MVRLVCTSPTLMGVVGLERRAAAAAADDSEVFELRRPNTAAAAVAALGSAVAEVKGCAGWRRFLRMLPNMTVTSWSYCSELSSMLRRWCRFCEPQLVDIV